MKKNEVANKKGKLGRILGLSISGVLSVLMVVALVVTNIFSGLISNVLDADTTKIINPVDDIYTSDFQTYEELVDYQETLGQEIEAEGIVMLRNDSEVLPFDSSTKRVSVFGQGSVDFVYGGSGSGSVSASKAVSLKTALESSGYTINTSLWDFYSSGPGKDYRKTYPDETGAGEFAVNEVPSELYTSEVIESFEEYNDAAIVVIGRSGGESADLPIQPLENGYRYLQIDNNERDMLEMAKDHFDKVIVIINASNPLELDFLEDYNIDACLWVGGVGQTGMYAIGEILNGNVNPSGRLVDTYAYDSTSAPSTVNMGDYDIIHEDANWDNKNSKYLVYGEGIYIGYRYYETRYEDFVMGRENVGDYKYQDEVQFPFGFGLSYTAFDHENFQVEEGADTFTVKVDVINTGAKAGKDVVQIYMQNPYTQYDQEMGIEKPSLALVGFAKTKVLEPGESQLMSIEVSKELMKVYDANGAETYIVEAGDYYITDARNAHDGINNILAAKGYSSLEGMTDQGDKDSVVKISLEESDESTYAVSQTTGEKITNAFEDVDIRYYDDSYTYLTRSNWTDTWPRVYKDGKWTVSDDIIGDFEFYRGNEVVNDGVEAPVTGKKPESFIYVSDLIGADFNDERWETLLDEMTVNEMTRLVRMGGYATVPIDSIGLPATTDKDGPSGFSSSLIPGRSGMAYPTQVVMASTWNQPLIEEMGRMIGEDSLAIGITGWYAPGANIHRSPYSGRNFEYYSEDGFLGGMICASEIIGARSKGVLAYMKHFALNDQEINRYGGAVFANEQAIREIFLKTFELAATEGKATGVMTSMNRIGARWSGAHSGLMTETLRKEWGFNGVAITDQASVPSMLYQDMISGLYAGTDLWLNTNRSLWSLDEYKGNPTVINHLRQASHHIIYAVANSNAMNGISPDTELVIIMPWWRKLLWIIAGLVWSVSAFVIVMITRKILKQRKQA